MERQHGTRRMFLAAAVVMVAALAGSAAGVAADAKKRPDFGSKEWFKTECEIGGGTFIEDGLGNTECHYPNGSWTECDANGNDCWHTPASMPQPGGNQGPYVGPGSEATADTGETDNPPPVVDTSTPAGAHQSIVASDDDQESDTDKGKKGKKSKKGKKHGKGGKGRNK